MVRCKLHALRWQSGHGEIDTASEMLTHIAEDLLTRKEHRSLDWQGQRVGGALEFHATAAIDCAPRNEEGAIVAYSERTLSV